MLKLREPVIGRPVASELKLTRPIPARRPSSASCASSMAGSTDTAIPPIGDVSSNRVGALLDSRNGAVPCHCRSLTLTLIGASGTIATSRSVSGSAMTAVGPS